MAVTVLNALFLAECWEGARFDSTLTLGRLNCLMWSRDLQRIARLLPSKSQLVESVKRGEVPPYMDDLFTAIGANRVDAMDASHFEGAAILQDLNGPLVADLHSQYDAVVDTADQGRPPPQRTDKGTKSLDSPVPREFGAQATQMDGLAFHATQ